jgi:hypothetical protein
VTLEAGHRQGRQKTRFQNALLLSTLTTNRIGPNRIFTDGYVVRSSEDGSHRDTDVSVLSFSLSHKCLQYGRGIVLLPDEVERKPDIHVNDRDQCDASGTVPAYGFVHPAAPRVDPQSRRVPARREAAVALTALSTPKNGTGENGRPVSVHFLLYEKGVVL